MKKKLAAIIVLALTSTIILTSCAQTEPPAPTPAPAPAETPAPEEQSCPFFGRTIVMGTNAEFPPFEFIAYGGHGSWGQYDGVDIVISMRIAEHLGANLEIMDMPFGGIITALAAGQIDFAAAALTITEERAQQIDFSIPYFTAYQTILVTSDNLDINAAPDIYGKTVGVQLGTTGNFTASGMPGVTIMTYNRAADAVIPLLNGQIDAIMVDSATAEFFYNAHAGDLRIIRDDEYFGREQYGIAVGQGNPRLLEAINEVLEEMLASGEIDTLVAYFSQH
ncbi:MAG: basic amino acid ABC transporter substrate-binding protein [Defluviitaleaceae bacterium]|nr:basic amino acid ABC transporter substrate-binding protein [Defluviitaleaceae bacterium]